MTNLSSKRPSSVYAIRCGEFIKIGFGESPRERLAAMRLTCPYPMELVASRQFPNAKSAYDAEGQIHIALASQRHWGEWFKMEPMDPVGCLKAVHAAWASANDRDGDHLADIDEEPATPCDVPFDFRDQIRLMAQDDETA